MSASGGMGKGLSLEEEPGAHKRQIDSLLKCGRGECWVPPMSITQKPGFSAIRLQAKMPEEIGEGTVSSSPRRRKGPFLWVRDATHPGETVFVSKLVSRYRHCLPRLRAEFALCIQRAGPGVGYSQEGQCTAGFCTFLGCTGVLPELQVPKRRILVIGLLLIN